ncbi:MAG: winged helix-turn-helix transcriptional regulator [Planctomycetota bacterium]|jgi:DNA-binding MarR family transcriptional regulator
MAQIDEAQEAWRDLQVLSEIEQDAKVSQRTLSERIGIALGLTNSVLKRLIKKGLIKTSSLPANRLAYYLTPKGFTEKSKLVLTYLKLTTSFFCRVRDIVNTRLQKLKDEKKIKTVSILGTGELSEAIYLSIKEAELELVEVFEIEPTSQKWLGIEVNSFSNSFNADVLLVSDADIDIDIDIKPEVPEQQLIRVSDLLATDLRAFAATMDNK